jgi:hypothetical protein
VVADDAETVERRLRRKRQKPIGDERSVDQQHRFAIAAYVERDVDVADPHSVHRLPPVIGEIP